MPRSDKKDQVITVQQQYIIYSDNHKVIHTYKSNIEIAIELI